jgi:hypothetical protein
MKRSVFSSWREATPTADLGWISVTLDIDHTSFRVTVAPAAAEQIDFQ